MAEKAKTSSAIGVGGFSTEMERILHLILANVDDLIAVVDLKGRRLYNSPSYRRILGDPKELRGTDSFGNIHPDDRAFVREVFEETVKTGVGRRIEYRFLRGDGTIFNIESHGNAITNNLGAPEGIVLVSRDITERKAAEKERNLLYSAVEQIPESIVITDLHGSIQYVNPAFERVSGYQRTEAIGKNPRFLKSGIHESSFYQNLWATLLRGEVWSGEITNKRKDGTLYQEEVIISPVRDGSGHVANFVAVQRDVTREREMERHLYAAQRMDSLAQLAGGIAHDFNNIMNVMQGVFGLVRSKTTDPDLLRFIRLGEGTLRRGAGAAKRLAAFSQREESRLVPLSIGEIVANLRDALNQTIEKEIAIDYTLEHQLPLCEGDAEKLLQGLLTICINARDAILAHPFRSGSGTIKIGVDSVDGRDVHRQFPYASAERYLRVSIADSGIGMSEALRQRIFEPFLAGTDVEKGRGFGLALAYATVKSHRGYIDVESKPGAGTTFMIYLPAIPAQTEEPSGLVEGTIPGGSETILVIEDEEALQLLLEAILVARGYKVMMANNGSDGLALYEEHQSEIDIVLTDMGLPKLSGRDVFMKIRELDPAAPVIFMSGFPDPTLKSSLYASGARAFIAKPFRAGDVLRKIREVLDLEER